MQYVHARFDASSLCEERPKPHLNAYTHLHRISLELSKSKKRKAKKRKKKKNMIPSRELHNPPPSVSRKMESVVSIKRLFRHELLSDSVSAESNLRCLRCDVRYRLRVIRAGMRLLAAPSSASGSSHVARQPAP